MHEIEILAKAELWFEENEHQKIVDLIESLPESEKTPKILNELGRAYNNLYWMDEDEDEHFLKKALEILKSVESDLKDDLTWQYRIGYSYFYLNDDDKAKFHFKKYKEMGGDEEDFHLKAIELANEKKISLNDALDKLFEEESASNFPEFFYEEDEMESLENFIENNFGKIDSVFHELVSPDIHCDIYIIKPTPERNYYTLVTGGMGAYKMNIPEGFEGNERGELMISLPADWEIKNEDEKWYWPLRWLKILARLPLEQNTFLGWGHTVPTGDNLENTPFNCIMLVGSQNLNFEDVDLELPNGDLVTFYTLVPLYPEETQFKLDHDAGDLLEKFDEYNVPYPPVVDVNRQNTCESYQTQPRNYLLDNIKWQFTDKVYSSLMNFVIDIKSYNENLDNELVDFNPFATIFDHKNIRVLYESFIKSKEDLWDFEILLHEDETFVTTNDNGLYSAMILATLTSDQENSFSSMYLLYQIHNTLSNKWLGKNIYFDGFEIEGFEENGTPVISLLLKS